MNRSLQLLIVILSAALGSHAGEALKVRVMSYNIHHAEGNDAVLDVARIAKIMTESKADLIAVQEVDHKTTRVQSLDQPAELGKLTALNAAFGKAMDYQGGGYGQVVLSRWEIKEQIVHQLPQREGREPRILLLAKIAHPSGDMWFGSVHLDHAIEEIRVGQVRKLKDILAELKGPLVIAGDFNAVPDADPIKQLLEVMDDSAGANALATIPAEDPQQRIDYILVSPKDVWKTRSSTVLVEKVASDHRPLIAELELLK